MLTNTVSNNPKFNANAFIENKPVMNMPNNNTSGQTSGGNIFEDLVKKQVGSTGATIKKIEPKVEAGVKQA